MVGRWDKSEKEKDENRKRFISRNDDYKDLDRSSRSDESDKPDKSNKTSLLDKIKSFKNGSDKSGNNNGLFSKSGKSNKSSSDVKYYRVFYIRTVDNKIDDIHVEHYETSESVFIGIATNSNGKMQQRITSGEGVVIFEWTGTPRDGKEVNYTAVSYSVYTD